MSRKSAFSKYVETRVKASHKFAEAYERAKAVIAKADKACASTDLPPADLPTETDLAPEGDKTSRSRLKP